MKTTGRERVTLQGRDALTVPQARALLKAGLAVLMRSDLNGDDDTLTPRERQSLSQAVGKLEWNVRDYSRES